MVIISEGEEVTCLHSKRSKINDSIVCTECGLVLSQDALVEAVINDESDKSHLWAELSHSQRILIEPIRRDMIPLKNLVDAICSKFNIPLTLCDQTMRILDELIKGKTVNRGRSGRRAAIAVLYILARGMNSLPISISELSLSIGETTEEMASMLSMVRPAIRSVLGRDLQVSSEPILFLEKLMSNMDNLLDFGSEEDKRSVVKLSEQICGFTRQELLSSGRKPEALAMACLIVAFEGLQAIPLGKNTQREICEATGVSFDTVQLRVNEVKDALLRESTSAPFLDVSVKLTRRNVYLVVPRLCVHLQHSEDANTTNVSLPPSFRRNQECLATRKVQIQMAKDRLADKINGSGATIDDIIIERLLLHNISENRIENASTLNQLMVLEDELFVGDEDASEGDEL